HGGQRSGCSVGHLSRAFSSKMMPMTFPPAPSPELVPRASAGSVHLSVVVPLYRCEECVTELYRRLVHSLEALSPSFEIVLVNDGSPQGDWDLVRALARRDHRVKAINLSRNFG